MKYQGRVVLVFLSILTSFAFWVSGKVISPLLIIFSLFHATISWVFGSLYDKYKFLSYHDPLTGVFNRRYVYHVFEKKFHRVIQRNEKVGILTIDINQFKAINDTFGHNYGDVILKELCRLVQKSIRKEDLLVRWGGDEFLVISANRSKRDTEQLMEQINESIKVARTMREEEIKNFPSISMGFSLFPEDDKKLSELIAISDERMYHVKHASKPRMGHHRHVKH